MSRGLGGKAARFGGLRPSALDEASNMLAPEREMSIPTQMIPVDQIDMDPDNVRPIYLTLEDLQGIREDDPLAAIKREQLEGIRSLANSIESLGMNNAVEVYRYGNRYTLLTGQRRYLAHRLLGKGLIRATLRMQRPDNPLSVQLTENVNRQDMSLAEQLASLQPTLDQAGMGGAERSVQHEFLYKVIGLSRATAYRFLNINAGPKALHDAIKAGIVRSAVQADQLARMEGEELQAAIERIVNGEAIDGPAPPEAQSEEAPTAATAPSESAPPASVKRARGRPTAVIKLGTVSKPNVIRGMFRDLLGEASVPDIDWNDFKAVSKAFQDMVAELEKRYE